MACHLWSLSKDQARPEWRFNVSATVLSWHCYSFDIDHPSASWWQYIRPVVVVVHALFGSVTFFKVIPGHIRPRASFAHKFLQKWEEMQMVSLRSAGQDASISMHCMLTFFVHVALTHHWGVGGSGNADLEDLRFLAFLRSAFFNTFSGVTSTFLWSIADNWSGKFWITSVLWHYYNMPISVEKC